MSFSILSLDDYESYFRHVEANAKSNRRTDLDILNKIKIGLERDDRLIVFIEKNENNEVIASMLTKKFRIFLQYQLINYRTNGDKYFKKQRLSNMWSAVFDYYEPKGYYKWFMFRSISMLNKKFFTDWNNTPPFNKYETAIEYAPSIMTNLDLQFYHLEIMSNLPDDISINDNMITAGFCKQEYRKLYSSLDEYKV